MNYCVIGKGAEANSLADKSISNIISEYSRHLYDFNRNELDLIVEYDLLNIMAFYSAKMNYVYQVAISDSMIDMLNLSDMEEVLDTYAEFLADDVYIPLSMTLIDKLGDSRITTIIFETLYAHSTEVIIDNWDEEVSYSNYLVLLHNAFFRSLSYRFHMHSGYKACLKEYFEFEKYDDFVESLYEKHMDDMDWDIDVDLDYLDGIIEESKKNPTFSQTDSDEYYDAIEAMQNIRQEHDYDGDYDGDLTGFNLLLKKTGMKEYAYHDVHGFQCYFCKSKDNKKEYIVLYQDETRIKDLVINEEEWNRFLKDIYYKDIELKHSFDVVYMIFVLDEDSDSIPIQSIESNRTYARKYVFTEEEACTFINGIIKTSNDEIGSVSPVHEWDRILKEEHLTACMTESYSAKKVDGYLSGNRFDAAYVDDEYRSVSTSKVPKVKWVKSLDTTGFRDFCFDNQVMEFGQINLFYGANGSGKTSVLEAIEYALTSEVRRVKDFKVKLPTDMYPRLKIYDTEAGVHTFSPHFSKNNMKEIERVWYGVPIGRTKSNLNQNFNRFNAFDSEAAYKFIHDSDNSEDTFASMFGNLMFGETVVDHEKKWLRFKRAFNEKYTELRSKLNTEKWNVDFYKEQLDSRKNDSKSEDLESGLLEIKYLKIKSLPKTPSDRYSILLDELSILKKYADFILGYQLDNVESFGQMIQYITDQKREHNTFIKEKKQKSERIASVTQEIGTIKEKIFSNEEKIHSKEDKRTRINRDIRNWEIVQNVLSHQDTIRLAENLVDELSAIDLELYYISKIEQRPSLVAFLKMDNYAALSSDEREKLEKELFSVRKEKESLESTYEEKKKAFGKKEQQSIELRKIGKLLLVDSSCPLCGHRYGSSQELLKIIDNAVVVDSHIDELITEIQRKAEHIKQLEVIIDRESKIEKALSDIEELSDTIPVINNSMGDYKKIYDFLISKTKLESRKEEIIEQQSALSKQGFSIKNISACREFTVSDDSYLEFKKSGDGDYSDYLERKLLLIEYKLEALEKENDNLQQKVKENDNSIELLTNELRRIDSLLDAQDMDSIRMLDQSANNITSKFRVDEKIIIRKWISDFNSLYDKCEYEVERLESQSMIAYERRLLEESQALVKELQPKVDRCGRAVQVFEKMPSLSSFVEKGIQSNIQQISKFFKAMHHSGEFEELGIDSEGIYAIRGFNDEVIRTYEMSTGQRATIAMAVMFALHMAAPDAPQFLLLDEPLATMDDTQVLNVLDILKSMADQNTQIFFTTANGIMIKLFKEHFKKTDFDYKEYQFTKRVNMPSEIKEISINDTKSIEELTLDDLTLDFNQFEMIREVLKRNQEKLVIDDEFDIPVDDQFEEEEHEDHTSDNFSSLLTKDELKLLNIIVFDDGASSVALRKKLTAFPAYKMMFESINDKAIDYFGETIVENDDELPWIDDYYLDELREVLKA